MPDEIGNEANFQRTAEFRNQAILPFEPNLKKAFQVALRFRLGLRHDNGRLRCGDRVIGA